MHLIGSLCIILIDVTRSHTLLFMNKNGFISSEESISFSNYFYHDMLI